jgi:hypothetical protein
MARLCSAEITGVRGSAALFICGENALSAWLRSVGAAILLAKYGYPADLRRHYCG